MNGKLKAYQRRLNRARRFPLTPRGVVVLLGALVFLGALGVLLLGCGGDFSQLPHQQLVERVIWRDMYGVTDEDPPPVEWVHDDEVTPGYAGMTLVGWKVRVACRFPGDGEGPCNLDASQTKIAHEFYHWLVWRSSGDVDISHRRFDWRPSDDAELAASQAVFDLIGGEEARVQSGIDCHL